MFKHLQHTISNLLCDFLRWTLISSYILKYTFLSIARNVSKLIFAVLNNLFYDLTSIQYYTPYSLLVLVLKKVKILKILYGYKAITV